MEKKSEETESEIAVYELPGEPAVVIDGVPKVNPDCNTLVLSNKEDGKSQKDKGCGEWLEGREVQKLFGERYYYGRVIQFDKETGWYKVEYEDGDAEDLDWHELEEVLLPVDVTVPLKTVALKMFNKNQKHVVVHKPEQLVPAPASAPAPAPAPANAPASAPAPAPAPAGSAVQKATKSTGRKGKKSEAR